MINHQYILCIEIPIFRDQHGALLCDPFWAKDLKLHLDYIADLSLCCPVIEQQHDTDMATIKKIISYGFGELEDISSFNIKLIPLHHCQGWLATFKNFIPNFFRVKNALKQDCIVHSDGAGWPFPISFYLLPLRLFYRFKWIMIIESTFMMMTKGEKFTLRKFLSHHVHSILLPLCLKYADARIFTHHHYKNMFYKGNEHVHIAEYSSLDSDLLIDEVTVEKKITVLKKRKLRFLLACRLIADKGIQVLFDAIEILQKKGVSAQIDMMGSGDLEVACRAFVREQQGSIATSFIEPVAYGVPFFKNLSTYDVLLMPNLSEEQPRIIFDAFGQGLTIIASDTEGLKQTCKHGINSIVFRRGDAAALAEAIEFAVNNTEKVVEMGLTGLRLAQTKTHQQMHRDREQFLSRVLS